MKFLIIEPDLTKFRKLEKEILSPFAFPNANVQHYSDLKSAQNFIKKNPIGCLFYEPTGSPLDVRHCVRSLRELVGKIPIIVMVEQGSEQEAIEVIRAGADDFIEKTHLNKKVIRRLVSYASERAYIRSELLATTKKAQRASQVKSAFLANMSHEFRTPLNLMIGTADLLLETNLTKEQRNKVHTFTSASYQLLSLLNNILDFSEVESRTLECVDRDFNIHEVFVESCETISYQCHLKKIEFKNFLDPKIPEFCHGDKVRLRQVFSHLLNNAVKFTSEGSIEVRFEAVNLEKDKITLSISVKDTGIGVSKSELKKITQNFYQSDAGTERKFRGAGLGLSVVKGIVENYKGQLDIKSESGKGFFISATLLLSYDEKKEQNKDPQSRKIVRGKKNNLNILIVDDDLDNRELIATYLQHTSYNVSFAKDGKEAIEQTKQKRFDLIVMDIEMPDLNGYEAARKIKKNGRSGKILGFSANGFPENILEAKSAGFSGYITKPMKKQEFLDSLVECLRSEYFYEGSLSRMMKIS